MMDTIKDIEKLKCLIGKKVEKIELRQFNFKTRRWNKGSGNITIIFADGTEIQGVDGEYGTNVIEII